MWSGKTAYMMYQQLLQVKYSIQVHVNFYITQEITTLGYCIINTCLLMKFPPLMRCVIRISITSIVYRLLGEMKH